MNALEKRANDLTLANGRKLRTHPSYAWVQSLLTNREGSEPLYQCLQARAANRGETVLTPGMVLNLIGASMTIEEMCALVRQSNSEVDATLEAIQQSYNGEGRYESPLQQMTTHRKQETLPDGKVKHHVEVRASSFTELEFPLAIAHPRVMDATGAAMAMKIFDRIGVVPQRVRRGDPIVLGQITRKDGWSTKTASFLIAWYLDVRTL